MPSTPVASETARYIGFGPTSTSSPNTAVPSAAMSSGRMPRAADPSAPTVDAPTQNLVVSACAMSPSSPAAGPRSSAPRTPLNTLSRAGRLVRSASVAQWKSSSVLRKGLGVRVPPGAPSTAPLFGVHRNQVSGGRAGGRTFRLRGRERCETKSKAASCGSPSSVQAVGGASTRASSREDRTRSSARSWAGTRPGPQHVLPRSAVPPTRTSTRCSTRERPDLVTVCLPNEGHFEPTLHLLRARCPAARGEAVGLRPRRGGCAAALKPTQRGLFFAINFNHRFAEAFTRAKAAIDAGEIGRPVFATWRFGGEANHGTSRHANLIETQCHGFDMLEHLVRADRVRRRAHDRHDLRATGAASPSRSQFENGAVGTMLGSYDCSYAYPDSQLVEVNGTAGRLIVHDTVREFVLRRPGDEPRRAAGGQGTSTTRPETSTPPSTATSTTSSRRSAPARAARPRTSRAGGRCSSRWPSSSRTRPDASSPWTSDPRGTRAA